MDPDWKPLATMLNAVLAGARVEDQGRDLVMAAITYDLLENREQQKPCKTCGHPVVDHRYWRVTGAGRLLAAALSTGDTGEGR